MWFAFYLLLGSNYRNSPSLYRCFTSGQDVSLNRYKLPLDKHFHSIPTDACRLWLPVPDNRQLKHNKHDRCTMEGGADLIQETS